MKLTDKKCVPCEGGTTPLTATQITNYKTQIANDWGVIDNVKLRRQFKFKDFKAAMEFVNKIAALAESEDHHPDIRISWNKVTINLTTHAIRGLSENDFIMAAKIDHL